MAASTVAPRIAQPEGFYCSTSGTVIQDRDELARHYQSEFHRYNLKRKVAGLPPVTKEWFEARRAQLVGSQAVASQGLPPGHIRVWFDPLLRKTFRSEQTYLAHTKSNKYLEAVRKSGQPAPPPVISVKKLADSDATAESVAGAHVAHPCPPHAPLHTLATHMAARGTNRGRGSGHGMKASGCAREAVSSWFAGANRCALQAMVATRQHPSRASSPAHRASQLSSHQVACRSEQR